MIYTLTLVQRTPHAQGLIGASLIAHTWSALRSKLQNNYLLAMRRTSELFQIFAALLHFSAVKISSAGSLSLASFSCSCDSASLRTCRSGHSEVSRSFRRLSRKADPHLGVALITGFMSHYCLVISYGISETQSYLSVLGLKVETVRKNIFLLLSSYLIKGRLHSQGVVISF